MTVYDYTLEWRCNLHVNGEPMSDAQVGYCHETAMRIVKKIAKVRGNTTIRFRCGVHAQTRQTAFLNDGSKDTRIIPDVPHYTAEYQIPKTDDWVTFHFYVKIRSQLRTFEDYVTPRGEPNPVIYSDRRGPSQSEDFEVTGTYFEEM